MLDIASSPVAAVFLMGGVLWYVFRRSGRGPSLVSRSPFFDSSSPFFDSSSPLFRPSSPLFRPTWPLFRSNLSNVTQRTNDQLTRHAKVYTRFGPAVHVKTPSMYSEESVNGLSTIRATFPLSERPWYVEVEAHDDGELTLDRIELMHPVTGERIDATASNVVMDAEFKDISD